MFALAGALLLAATAAAQSQTPAAPSIEGVWKIAESVTTGANAQTISAPQPSLIIFSAGHYAYLAITGANPRTKAETVAQPTDAQKLAKFAEWDALTANAGTYSVKGTTLTRRPTVAKNESVMASPPLVDEIKLEGKTLWLTSKAAAGQPASETRRKLVRVQ